MNLLYKKFLLCATKYVEVFVRKTDNEVGIRFVNSSNPKERKYVSLTINDIFIIVNNKFAILTYLDSGIERMEPIPLSTSKNGETQILCSSYNEEPYVHIRYFYNDKGNLKGTSYGIVLNSHECIQLFRELENIVSYIRYIRQYSTIVPTLFEYITDDMYSIINKECSADSQSLNINSFITSNYRSLSAKLDTAILIDKINTYCRKNKIKSFNKDDLSGLIELIIKEEVKNIGSVISKRDMSTILKTMLSERSSAVGDE
jgi:Transcriptional Coactivator p15 (PC4)